MPACLITAKQVSERLRYATKKPSFFFVCDLKEYNSFLIRSVFHRFVLNLFLPPNPQPLLPFLVLLVYLVFLSFNFPLLLPHCRYISLCNEIMVLEM